MTPLELWGGVEATVNRVGDTFFDQLVRSGHDARADDLDRFAATGIRALRQPVLWERVAPRGLEACDWTWADARLTRMRDLGIRPIVGLLHHGSGPSYTSLLDDTFPEQLARFARAAAERYPWVREWTPVNEPLTTARFSALYGHWYPHSRTDREFVTALLNQIRGTVLAMREIRAVNPAAELIQTEDLGRSFGTAKTRRQTEFECQRRWLTWDLLEGRVDRTHPLYRWLLRAGADEGSLEFLRDNVTPVDVLGINYYLTSDRWLDDRIDLYPPAARGGNGAIRYADVEAVRARARGIVGHERHLLDAWQRYGRAVALTEVHLGCTREEQMRWLVEAWQSAERARARGADVRGVTAWALLGSFDWDSLVTRQSGHYEPGLFDVRGPAPRRTAIAAVAHELTEGVAPSHPVLHTEGWWRRPSRLTSGPDASSASAHPLAGPPILIVGRRGTLGRAFERICERRGLRAVMASRVEMDIGEPARIDAMIRAVNPWAVVNAAGYVRVDDAEADPEGCWRENVQGAVNLAAACRRRRLPLVTFSSDLVFDGSLRRPYAESDPTAPLNQYGRSKAEAERRVLELLPNALVVRTSAFFGPWDAYNFATLAIRAMRAAEPFRAADDAVVSPTYVPDLVDAVLDLLIDGERGVWHLANQGAVTWFEFAGAAIAAAGEDGSALSSCGYREIWSPAERPVYSVLGSERGLLLRPLEAALAGFAGDMASVEAAESARRASS